LDLNYSFDLKAQASSEIVLMVILEDGDEDVKDVLSVFSFIVCC